MTQQNEASFGQGLALAARFAECFPRNVPRAEVQAMVDDRDFWLRYLAEAREAFARRPLPVPEAGTEFELELPIIPVSGLGMVRKAGGCDTGFKFVGSEILAGPHTGTFKLVWVSNKDNLECVCRVLKTHGRIPEGQWLTALKTKFSKPGGRGPIGIADPSWLYKEIRHFPFFSEYYQEICFTAATEGLNDNWRWLVEVERKK